jgi:hypothetical protein
MLPYDMGQRIVARFGYIQDLEHSTEETRVYLDSSLSPTIVHRGSITAEDWLLEDSLIITGLSSLLGSPRITRARAITEEVENLYGPADAMGHSLGGRVAEESGAHGWIYTYQKAAGLADIAKTVNPKQTDYRTTGDIVSILSKFQKRHKPIRYVGGPEAVGSHSLTHLKV